MAWCSKHVALRNRVKNVLLPSEMHNMQEVIKTKNACLTGGDERFLEIKQRFTKLSLAKEEHA